MVTELEQSCITKAYAPNPSVSECRMAGLFRNEDIFFFFKQKTAYEITSRAPAPHWDELGSPGHSVQFYADDSFLLEGLGQFVGATLVAGDAALGMATRDPPGRTSQRVGGRGVGFQPPPKKERYFFLVPANNF